MKTLFIIYSFEREMFWKANQRGYTKLETEAGKYTLDEALEICRSANIGKIQEAMIPA